MARGKPLTVVGFMTYEDGRVVPWETLPYEERLRINKTWIDRLERVMPEYYRNHPDEFGAAYEEAGETTPEQWERYYQLFPEKRESPRATNTKAPT